ncbi:hypothetical protein BC828DRAFT_378162 [Blastocladiella britannica]|nr:hypothetical protein BC828DRAFT_378162 [Blastocladiella britannica]
MPLSPETAHALLSDATRIRNLCILAHVDHGKTTLSDSLLATNGIISPKQAGQIRYLDSRPDEQQRGITMKASSIALHFCTTQRSPLNANELVPDEYLINLIDCPGHVDFTSEVSTASRLCDGAFILVDAVEGVCSQTHTVLHQAWTERLKPVLVINKVDRLAGELQMTATEAYQHMAKIIQHANSVVGTFYQSELAEKDLVQPGADHKGGDEEDDDDEHLYFSPQQGNVIFSSAIHGWAFRMHYFARLYAAKLKIKEEVLLKYLWGEHYLDPKTKRILGPAQLKGRDLKPLAVQFMLDNVWAVYEACGLAVTATRPGHVDTEKVTKIAAALGLKLHPRDLKPSVPAAALAANVLAQWLPLSTTLLVTAVQQIPSPLAAQPLRMPRALPMLADAVTAATATGDAAAIAAAEAVRDAVHACDPSATAPVVAFLAKMVAVPRSGLPQNAVREASPEELRARRAEVVRRQRAAEAVAAVERSDAAVPLSDDMAALAVTTPEQEQETTEPETDLDGDVLIGMARIYSGRLEPGMPVYVLGPKYDPLIAADKQMQHVHRIVPDALYLLMGREVLPLPAVSAGAVFALGGAELENAVLKTATVSSTTACASLAGVSSAAPIVRVAVEPRNPIDMPKLIEGLRLLNQSDPAVEVVVGRTGEHLILTSGELHLERCLVDLRERFAKCTIEVSAPIVPFRETITDGIPQPQFQVAADSALPQGTVEQSTSNGLASIRLRLLPLPARVRALLDASEHQLKAIVADPSSTASVNSACAFLRDLDAATATAVAEDDDAKKHATTWRALARNLWALGPKRTGNNVLVNEIPEYEGRGTWVLDERWSPSTSSSGAGSASVAEWDNTVVTGFQMAAAAGPLCAEPMWGVAMIVERVDWRVAANTADGDDEPLVQSDQLLDGIDDDAIDDAASDVQSLPSSRAATPSAMNTSTSNTTASATVGAFIGTVRSAARAAFLARSPRLVLATYACAIECRDESLGHVYNAVAKRRGRIVAEDLREGTPYYVVQAVIPVVESFGFAEAMRTRTSGGASPQLVFSGWELAGDGDPFWVPATELELEDLGSVADKENVSRRYMDAVRKRKGLLVEGQKIVKDAEKQRTLSKK